ncbi:MAG: hypothetical protein R2779_03370 [Crocinitomicaceae bacterium]
MGDQILGDVTGALKTAFPDWQVEVELTLNLRGITLRFRMLVENF